jgi:hypothetical protein
MSLVSRHAAALCLFWSLWLGGTPLPGAEDSADLICCGAAEVFILRVTPGGPDEPERVWIWSAADSSAIEASAHRNFRTTDDCKPYGGEILITSSSGGVALVRRDDKSCRFYAFSRNAHSACLIPQGRVAVAASFGGDELQLFAIGAEPRQTEPLATLPLIGAHGAEWDEKRRRIWALGSEELQLVKVHDSAGKVQLVKEEAWKLPTSGGHDLAPTADGRGYYVTTDAAVYRFDTAVGTFTPHPRLGESKKVKSVDEQRTGGRLVYHQATADEWWSDTIRFDDSDATLRLPDQRLYKVRWDQPRKVP